LSAAPIDFVLFLLFHLSIMDAIIYRPVNNDETYFLKEMLWEAIFLPAETKRKLTKALLEHPDICKYYHGWGRPGDVAIVAVRQETGMLAGCAWGRLFNADDKGYGYIDDETPELSIAVDPAFRDRGIGTKLLQEIIEVYRMKAYPKLSLSVNKDNPSVRLYLRTGFKIYASKDDSLIMQYKKKFIRYS
jgi:ribosomal-protein-alanine N-acetyltransferase